MPIPLIHTPLQEPLAPYLQSNLRYFYTPLFPIAASQVLPLVCDVTMHAIPQGIRIFQSGGSNDAPSGCVTKGIGAPCVLGVLVLVGLGARLVQIGKGHVLEGDRALPQHAPCTSANYFH